jgi:hypothetical protein
MSFAHRCHTLRLLTFGSNWHATRTQGRHLTPSNDGMRSRLALSKTILFQWDWDLGRSRTIAHHSYPHSVQIFPANRNSVFRLTKNNICYFSLRHSLKSSAYWHHERCSIHITYNTYIYIKCKSIIYVYLVSICDWCISSQRNLYPITIY